MSTPVTTSVKPAAGAVHVDSPDASVNAGKGANVAQAKLSLSLPKDARDLIIATVLALSIVINLAMFVAYRALTQTVDLDRYDDNTFINGRFAELSAQVKADHDLIQAYGLQKSLKERTP